MITQKIAQIIEKNTQTLHGYGLDGDLGLVNAVPVNTLIRELCKLFNLTNLGSVHNFNAHDFTQTALGLQEREYRVFFTGLIVRSVVVTAKSRQDAIKCVKSTEVTDHTAGIEAVEVKN